MTFPFVSVIIPVYNGERDLALLLGDLFYAPSTGFEVIVVDDGSTDGTRRIAEGFPQIRLLALPRNRGPAHARNAGAALARGEILVFVDADVRLPRELDVIGEIAHIFRARPGVDCVSAPSDVRPTVPCAIAFNASVYHAYYMDRIFGGKDSVEGRIMFFTTRLGGIRRAKFQEAGGFYESLYTVMNEDGEFGTRCYGLGYVSCFDRRLSHGHRFPDTFRRFARSYFLSAMVQAMVDRKYDTSPDPSLPSAEKWRRLLAAGGLVGLPLAAADGPTAFFAIFAAWGAAFFLSLGRLNSLVRNHVPPRLWAAWYAVYVLITPVILAGYAWGLLRHAAGRSLLGGRPSEAPFFQGGETR